MNQVQIDNSYIAPESPAAHKAVPTRWVRPALFIVPWFMAVGFCFYVAQFPGGYREHPFDEIPTYVYPLLGVTVFSALLASFGAALYFLIRPASYKLQPGRTFTATLMSFMVLLLGISMAMYAPPFFLWGIAWISLQCLILLVASLASIYYWMQSTYG